MPAQAVLVAGAMAFDSIQTATEQHVRLLGGSGTYAGYAASFYAPVKMLGMVGDDFPDAYRQPFLDRGIDLTGMETAPGKTFHWSAQYETDMNVRRTLSLELNVKTSYSPTLPEAYQDVGYVLLANDPPAIQIQILDQLRRPKFVIADTIDFWIEKERATIESLLRRVDLIVVNDSEARALTGAHNTIQAARQLLSFGPKYVIVKKGEHGSILIDRENLRVLPAYPVEEVIDPTGSGDCFVGALLGYCAQKDDHSMQTLWEGLIQATLIASFNLEAFTIGRLQTLTREEVAAREKVFRKMIGAAELSKNY